MHINKKIIDECISTCRKCIKDCSGMPKMKRCTQLCTSNIAVCNALKTAMNCDTDKKICVCLMKACHGTAMACHNECKKHKMLCCIKNAAACKKLCVEIEKALKPSKKSSKKSIKSSKKTSKKTRKGGAYGMKMNGGSSCNKMRGGGSCNKMRGGSSCNKMRGGGSCNKMRGGGSCNKHK